MLARVCSGVFVSSMCGHTLGSCDMFLVWWKRFLALACGYIVYMLFDELGLENAVVSCFFLEVCVCVCALLVRPNCQ